MYTSSKNAIILGNEEGIAPGWVYGPSHFNYANELLDIMGYTCGLCDSIDQNVKDPKGCEQSDTETDLTETAHGKNRF